MVDQRFSRLLPTLIAGVALILPAGVLKTSAQRAQVSAPSDDADQPVRTSVQNPGAVAIVIGIGQYQDRDIPPAGYAVNDADAVVRVLTQTLGYSPQRVIQLKNEQASFGRIRAAVRNRLAALAQPDKSDVFFYYSGHGEPNVRTREGFLIPYDFDSQDQPSPETAYGLKDLYADLAGLNARSVTVVIESCFSGQSKNGPLLKSARPLGIEVDNPALGLANGVVITASGAAEIASDHPERPHGLMTYYWLRAMRGEAAADGRLTPEKLKQYLQDKVKAAARSIQRAQTPEVVTAKPGVELARLPVSTLATGEARLVERTGALEIFIDLGGDLFIDGTLQGTIRPGSTYQNDRIAAGQHRLEVRKAGYETKQDDVVVIPDQTTRKQYLLSANLPTAGRLDRVYGLIQVSADRGGTLYIDDRKETDLPPFAPYTTARMEAGPHRVRVEKAGYVTSDQEVMVRPNDTARLDVALKAVAAVNAPAPANPVATASSRDAATGMEFVRIQPGEFMMGCSASDNECFDSEKPAHRVRITKGFEMGKYEVTQAQWESAMGSNPSNFKGANRPVEQVTWNDVQTFLGKLNSRNDGYRYRLPTEAEWEYAARAGTTGAYAGSLDAMGWYDKNSGGQTHAVGQKSPNGWGLYEMHGNVWEWVEDWYDSGYYAAGEGVDPKGPRTGTFRVIRGGSWYLNPRLTRVSNRNYSGPAYRNFNGGFRCVREAF